MPIEKTVRNRRTTLAAALTLALSPAAGAQVAAAPSVEPTQMTIGSAAPVPKIEKFVRGKEPTWFEPGKTYVIEFWATWCGPCRASMPHMSDLSERFAGKAVFVGVSDEPVARVTEFLEKDEWRQKARYNLATDPDRSTQAQYMTAAAQTGIPCAFVVRDGTVQWIGHPMAMDGPLAQVIDGTWKADDFKAEFEREAAAARKEMARRSAIAKARKSGDWDAILRILDEDIASADAEARPGVQVEKFKLLVSDAGRPAEGYRLGRELLGASRGNPALLNEMAWFVVDNSKVKERDFAFALEAAKAAVEASGAEDGSIMDTLARAYWESGDKAKAVEWQRKAVGKASGEMAAELSETLRKYESGDPPAKKTSLRADDGSPAAAPGVPAAVGAPEDGAAPASPRKRMEVALSPEAERIFPPLEPEGFESPEAIVAYVPKEGADTATMLRLLRAQRSTSAGGKLMLRISAATVEDMGPVVTASLRKFREASQPIAGVPAIGANCEVVREGDDRAALVGRGADGKPNGQRTELVKADGKWFFDFDRSMGPRAEDASGMAMMANLMGPSIREATRAAAEETAKGIEDGTIPNRAKAIESFSQGMQRRIMALAPMGGPGGPARGPSAGGAGAPAAPPAAKE